MPVRRLRDDEQLGLRRGDAVVCIPVYGAVGDFAQCLASVVEHTPADVLTDWSRSATRLQNRCAAFRSTRADWSVDRHLGRAGDDHFRAV